MKIILPEIFEKPQNNNFPETRKPVRYRPIKIYKRRSCQSKNSACNESTFRPIIKESRSVLQCSCGSVIAFLPTCVCVHVSSKKHQSHMFNQYTCPCGMIIPENTKTNHLKSKNHQVLLEKSASSKYKNEKIFMSYNEICEYKTNLELKNEEDNKSTQKHVEIIAERISKEIFEKIVKEISELT
jgi:hypothetical protein